MPQNPPGNAESEAGGESGINKFLCAFLCLASGELRSLTDTNAVTIYEPEGYDQM